MILGNKFAWLSAILWLLLATWALSDKALEAYPLVQMAGQNAVGREFNIAGRPVRLIIDTGADVSALDKRTVRKLRLRPSEKLEFRVQSLTGKTLGNEGGILPLRIGAHELSSEIPFVFLPGLRGIPGRAQGLLGVNALRKSGALLDIGNRRIITPGSAAARVLPSGSDAGSGWEALPFIEAEGRGQVFVRSTYGGRDLIWMVDSGATSTVLSLTTAHMVALKTKRSRATLTDGGGGSTQLHSANLRGIRWGKGMVVDQPVYVGALPSLGSYALSTGDPVAGLVGMDFLNRHSGIIDFSDNRLFLNHQARQ